MFKSWLKRGTLTVAAAVLLSAPYPGVHAQEAALEEIVVTARKREENLQQVPLSITAFTSDMLESAGIDTLRDLSYLTPGLTMLDFGAETFTVPNIRGLTQSNTGGGENNVSIFIDGVYIYNFNVVNLSLIDLERIEVIKGPVSALYGRNSFAGAINYVTRKPGNELEGRAAATLGSDDRYSFNAAIGGPLVEDTFSARIAFNYDNFGGTWGDDISGRNVGGYEKTGIQASFLLTPSEVLEVSGALYYGDDTFDPPARSFITANCAMLGPNNREYCGEIPDGDEVSPQAPVEVAGFGETGNDREVLFANVRGSLDLEFGTLEALFGYNDVDFTRLSSLDNRRDGLTYRLVPGPGTVNLSSYFGQNQRDEDSSFEARLSSNEDQSLRWTVGGFVYSLERDVDTFLTVPNDPIPAGQRIVGFPALFLAPAGQLGRIGNFVAETDQVSGFAGVEFDLSGQFTLGAELRYTEEEKTQDETRGLVAGVDTDGPGSDGKWDFWDTRVTLDYQYSDDVLLYASVAKGSKSGGFNAVSFASDRDYGPETNWTYEVGAKTTLADGRLLLNAAVFYIDWTNLQIRGIPDDPTNPGTVIKNLGDADTQGFEVEFSAVIADGFVWGGGLAFTDPKFGNNAYDATARLNCSLIPDCAPNIVTVAGRQLVDLKGFSLHRQSDWQFNTNIALDGDLNGNWRWFARGDFIYHSKQFAKPDNLAYFGERQVLNARVGAESDTLEVTVWAENLLDDTTGTINGTSVQLNNFITSNQPLLPSRRTFGVTVRTSF